MFHVMVGISLSHGVAEPWYKSSIFIFSGFFCSRLIYFLNEIVKKSTYFPLKCGDYVVWYVCVYIYIKYGVFQNFILFSFPSNQFSHSQAPVAFISNSVPCFFSTLLSVMENLIVKCRQYRLRALLWN